MTEVPYLFIYPGLWREYKVAAYKTKILDDKYKNWADFRLVPALTIVPANMPVANLSSNALPTLNPTLAQLPMQRKNTFPSISKYTVQTYDDPCRVSYYLINRGWELTSGIVPLTPYEIADIERIAKAGQPKWEEKIKKMEEQSTGTCSGDMLEYLF
jgi:hypothetical protein